MDIKSIFESHLGSNVVEEIVVASSLSDGGEPVMKINIVFREGTSEPSVELLEKALSELWEALTAQGEGVSPIVSFFDNSDSEKGMNAAA